MKYIYKEGKPEGQKFILLHGTGGDEHSLLEIASFLDSDATILSFRGEVNENGMNRFFKRNGLNQFDIESLEAETDALLKHIFSISLEKNISLSEWKIIGYSNGANIAAHLLLEREVSLKYALLLHPMFLGVNQQHFSLEDKNIWASFGENDPIVSEEAFQQLIQSLQERGASVVSWRSKEGHQLSLEELQQAKGWVKINDEKQANHL